MADLPPHPKDNLNVKFRTLRAYADKADKTYERKGAASGVQGAELSKVKLIEIVTSVPRS